MSRPPRLRRSGHPAPHSRDSDPWVDLIAFLGVLTLGGVLIIIGRTTAGSLATVCAALGALYAVWRRFRSTSELDGIDEPASSQAYRDAESSDHDRPE
jgi:hypothetical protein